jgi:hypothetical protein
MEKDFEEIRRKAFLDYQKTGVMNDIVRKEFEDYAKQEFKGIKVLAFLCLALFLFVYGGAFALCLWKFIHNGGKLWGFLSLMWIFVSGVGIYVVVKSKMKKGKRR